MSTQIASSGLNPINNAKKTSTHFLSANLVTIMDLLPILHQTSAPVTSSDSSPLQSYTIQRHDASSVVLVDQASVPQAREPRFAVRIHSDSIYLYRPAKKNKLFEEPVMEASIKGLIHRRDAKLDDWREKRGGHKGKYRLRHRKGSYVYTGATDDSKEWREDDEGCLHLTDNTSPTRETLASLKVPPESPFGLDKLHNLTGQIDLLDESVTKGVEEELAILTCITTHVINRRAQATSQD